MRLGRLLTAAAGRARRTADGDLGQCASPSGDAIRAYLPTPGLNLHLVNLPTYSPYYNADEAIWGGVRQEATANRCLETCAAVRERVDGFFTDPAHRREEVKRRCRTARQAHAAELTGTAQAHLDAALYEPVFALQM